MASRQVRSDLARERFPFQVGESFHYKLSWATFAHAADVQLDFVERRDLFGQATLHFRAGLHSFPPLRTLFLSTTSLTRTPTHVRLTRANMNFTSTKWAKKKNASVASGVRAHLARVPGRVS